MPTLSEIRRSTPALATASDEEIRARAEKKGVKIDPEPPSTSSGPNGNGGAPSRNLAAAARTLAERNAKPHVWEEFAARNNISVDQLKTLATAPQQEGPGWLRRTLGAGVAEGVLGLPGLPGNALELMGLRPSWLPTSQQTIQYLAQPGSVARQLIDEPAQGTAEQYGRTISAGLPLGAVGGGIGLLSAATGGAASEAAGQATKGSKYEPYARLAGGVAGGAPFAFRAPIPASSAAERTIAQSMRTEQPALGPLLRSAQDLGPEAALYNLTQQGQGMAGTLAALPTAGAARLRGTMEQQIRSSKPRVEAGLDAIFGSGETKAKQLVEQQLTRGSQAEIYQQNRPLPIDPIPVRAKIAAQLAEHPRGTAPHAELRRLDNILTDPGMPDNASKLLAMRGHIRTRIEAAGVAKGADEFSAFEEGAKTPTGHALMPVYQEINGALPGPIRHSDAILANAADVATAGQVGGTQIFGRGARMDPAELERRYGVASTASPAERAALLARTRQAGAHMLGETQAEANVGRATTNAIASQNVLDRVRAIAGPEAAQRLEQLAMRENVIGGQAGRALYNSETARRLRGGQAVPIPGERTMGPGNVTGAIIGATGDISQAATGLAGAVLEGALKKILNAPMKRRDTAVSDAMADILRTTGGNRDAALMRLYSIRQYLPPASRALLGVTALINGLEQSSQPSSQGLLQ
jgi:hypothetical protein